MKKIVIFTQNLDFGGVQKSVTTLANYLIRNEYNINIVLAEDNKNIVYPIDLINVYKIKTLPIDIEEKGIGIKLFNYRVSELNSILEEIKPDICISFEDYHNLISLSCSFSCKKIISCRVSLEDTYVDSKIHILPSEFYFRNIVEYYPTASKIVCVSNAIVKELKERVNLENVITIYNGIEDKIIPKASEHKNFILNIGRLHSQKGHTDLIKAFYNIKDKVDCNLLIVGDGPERDSLCTLIEKLSLKDRVYLVGYDNPYKYIQGCDLFVFPSYYEGFSNAILEVMSCSKNIVSYRYKGSDEILFDENLCELGNIEALSNKILFFLNDKDKNEEYENKLYSRSKEFCLEKTLASYKKEIDTVCAE